MRGWTFCSIMATGIALMKGIGSARLPIRGHGPILLQPECPEPYWSSHPGIADCHLDTSEFPMNMWRVIGKNGNAKSTGIKIKTGEEAMKKPEAGTKGVGDMEGETDGLRN